MRAAAIALLFAAPAAACPWHGPGRHISPFAEDRFGMAGPMFPFDEPAAAVARPQSREEALATLKDRLLATTPALRPQAGTSSSNSDK